MINYENSPETEILLEIMKETSLLNEIYKLLNNVYYLPSCSKPYILKQLLFINLDFQIRKLNYIGEVSISNNTLDSICINKCHQKVRVCLVSETILHFCFPFLILITKISLFPSK